MDGTVIRCKFKCFERGEREGWGGHKKLYSYKFGPVTDGSDENKKFFAATPSGSFNVETVLVDAFEVGKAYYLDITPAE